MKRKFPEPFFDSNKGIALRHSSNTFATKLVAALGEPITSTSANISGKAPCYSVASVVRQFGKRKLADVLIIDAGTLSRNKPSTVVTVRKGIFKVLRKGSIPV